MVCATLGHTVQFELCNPLYGRSIRHCTSSVMFVRSSLRHASISNSRVKSCRKPKIDERFAHVMRNLRTSFKVKRSESPKAQGHKAA